MIDRFDLRKIYRKKYYEDARKELSNYTDVSEDRKSGVLTVTVTDKDKNRDFCAILVDYVSAWHFEVSEQLVTEAKAFGDQQALKLAEEINPRINDITQIALAFNDHCEKGECTDTERFADKLGKLGGLMHERFELEDCLIEVLHNAHKEEGAVQA